MGARELMGAGIKVLCSAKAVDDNTTPVVFDFGTPDDIYLPGVASAAKKSGDRLALLLIARRTSGTTSVCTFSVWDAPATNPTTIGATGVAVTDASDGMASGADTDLVTVVGIAIQTGRPFLRVGFVLDNGTDVFTCQAALLAIPQGL